MGETYTSLAERYIDEGLRHADHPGIDFVDGPAGRRARIVGTGLAVWELIEVFRANDRSTATTAAYLDIPEAQVLAALDYYGDYPDEVDDWIERNRSTAEREQARWLRARQATG